MNPLSPEEFDIQWYIDEGFGNIYDLKPQTDKKLIINAAITGMVPRKTDTPHVPITPAEIIEDAVRCYEAGASIIHFHAREDDGTPTYKAEVYKEFVAEVRRRCPDLIICLTTSGRLFNKLEYRSEVLHLEGDYKPDMASLTLGSMNFPKQASVNDPEMIQGLASYMRDNGVKPELEVFETGMINYGAYITRKGFLVDSPQYFNLLLGSLGAIPARISDLDHLLATLPKDCVWAATGVGRFQLPINLIAILKGGNVRVGIEDNIFYDCHKQQLASNEQLIQRLVGFAKSIGREIATPAETRKLLQLKPVPTAHVQR